MSTTPTTCSCRTNGDQYRCSLHREHLVFGIGIHFDDLAGVQQRYTDVFGPVQVSGTNLGRTAGPADHQAVHAKGHRGMNLLSFRERAILNELPGSSLPTPFMYPENLEIHPDQPPTTSAYSSRNNSNSSNLRSRATVSNRPNHTGTALSSQRGQPSSSSRVQPPENMHSGARTRTGNHRSAAIGSPERQNTTMISMNPPNPRDTRYTPSVERVPHSTRDRVQAQAQAQAQPRRMQPRPYRQTPNYRTEDDSDATSTSRSSSSRL